MKAATNTKAKQQCLLILPTNAVTVTRGSRSVKRRATRRKRRRPSISSKAILPHQAC
jgi:hypothetical protein